MKTWEMIKELTEHPEKKFKAIVEGEEVLAEVRERINISDTASYPNTIGLYTSEDGWEVFPINNYTNKHEWEEVIEPVDFLTAYKDCLENGTKYKGVDGIDSVMSDQIMQRSNRYNEVQIIYKEEQGCVTLSGKWKKVSK